MSAVDTCMHDREKYEFFSSKFLTRCLVMQSVGYATTLPITSGDSSYATTIPITSSASSYATAYPLDPL